MKRKILSLFAVATLLTLAACREDYLDINIDPNSATSSTPDLVLTNALNVTASRLVHHQIGAFWSGQWSPTGSVSGFQTEKTYAVSGDFGSGIWNSTYDNLNDYQYIETRATELNQPAFVGIAKVMKAFNFQILVDTYGNVPYTEALKGTTAIRPKYDDAKMIYASLITELGAAVTELSKPVTSENPSPGQADIVFKGDLSKWVRFANTLRLRMLIRQTNVTGLDVKGEIAKITGGYLAAGEDVLADPGYLKTLGKLNPFYANYGFTEANVKSGNKDFYTFSDYFITTLKSLADTSRLARIAYKPEDALYRADYRGVPFGEGNDAYTAPKISAFGPAFLPTLATVGGSELYKRAQPLMLASESFFLQAEAAQRGYTTGDAKTLYETGVKESFRYLGVPGAAAAATAYLTGAANFATATDKIQTIVTQKWISHINTNGFEAWAEFRRTGFPNAPLSTRAQGTQHPRRLLYPTNELGTNGANVTAQGTIDAFTKLFWQK